MPRTRDSIRYRTSKKVLNKLGTPTLRDTQIMAIARRNPRLADRFAQNNSKRLQSIAKINESERLETMPDLWFGLRDNETGKIKRHQAMTWHKANKLNKANRELGISWTWTRCEPC